MQEKTDRESIKITWWGALWRAILLWVITIVALGIMFACAQQFQKQKQQVDQPTSNAAPATPRKS